jgi:integrative and conjugative element protein (TIGR02256 family)
MTKRRFCFYHPMLPYDIEFMPEPWFTIHGFAQRWPWSKEAGGQLFGSFNDFVVRIAVATPPRKGDERSRQSFKIDVVEANIEIVERQKTGLMYLGDWHTHPEERAKPSIIDTGNASRLFRGANGKPFLVMAIVGLQRTYIGVHNASRLMALERKAEPYRFNLWTL